MFPFHTEEFIRSQTAERERTARHARALYDLRALRGATLASRPSLARRLAAALAAYASAGSTPDRGAPVKAAPCPEAMEAMSS
jgi:hypothetical protein